MAFCTGLIVANIYYCQPLIILISKSFHVAESRAGVVTFLTQLGYALGLLFFVPLGDKLERKKHILFTTSLTVLSLIAAAIAPTLLTLEVASLLIGMTSIVPQLILPLSAHLAKPENRGKVIGTVMSGLLIGILLSRTLSGFIGAWLGWRGMYWVAAAISTALLVLMYFSFPFSKPNFKGTYASLMKSLLTLFKQQPLLREAAGISFFSFATFGMFWTTMVLHFAIAPFYFHSDKLGMFGLAAVAGALIAPLIGGSADKNNPRIAIGYGIVAMLLAYILFYVCSLSITGFVVGIILLDLGQQSIHVSNQSRVFALLPEARNRLNTVYMTVSFIGTSFGSAIGLLVWDRFAWTGVCITGCVLMSLSFSIYILTYKRREIALT
ncbi:MAG: MFS transporter [Bacteroidetes bacterium]|nr:MFS transporter [Bacteroidota bacterium]